MASDLGGVGQSRTSSGAVKGVAAGPKPPQPRPALPVHAQSTMPVVGLNDMKEENDDDERQAYYAGGNTAAGGGRCATWRPCLHQ